MYSFGSNLANSENTNSSNFLCHNEAAQLNDKAINNLNNCINMNGFHSDPNSYSKNSPINLSTSLTQIPNDNNSRNVQPARRNHCRTRNGITISSDNQLGSSGSNNHLSREERRRRRRATQKYRLAHATRERIRVEAFNVAFSQLRHLLPTLPPDKKLSKIEILRLAICYIAYLNHVLDV